MAVLEGGNRGRTSMQWLIAILANMAIFNFGLQCGWIACMAKTLQSAQSPTGAPLSDSEISWLAGAPSLAATVSVTVYTILVDKYGRKKCIIMITVFQASGWILKLCPANTASLIVARICCGIGGGGCFSVIPMYVKEISEDNLRGTLGALVALSQNIGLLIIYAMGGFMPYYTVLWVVVGVPMVTALGMLKAPESPSFLVKVGKIEDATKTIAFLRCRNVNDKFVLAEIEAIKYEEERFNAIPKITYLEIFKHKAWRRGFTFMILLMICHGLNGGFTIMNYASTILEKSGVTISLELQSLSIPAFMVIGGVLSMAFVERLGRKIILSSSFILSVASFSALSAILLIQELGGWVPVPGFLSSAVIVVSVCAYAMGVSPLPFIIMAELFNFQIRAKVMGVLVTLGWLFSFVQVLSFGPIASNFGNHIAFLCFAVDNLCGAFVILVLLPETKGKTIEELESELENR